MAIIRKNELKNINPVQITERLIELRKELMKFNAQKAVGTAIENPGRIKELRRSVAKLLTVQNQNKTTREAKKIEQKHE